MPEFEVTMGGYDIKEVDKLVALVEAAQYSQAVDTRQDAIQILNLRRAENFRRRFRGYSKIQVRNYIGEQIRKLS